MPSFSPKTPRAPLSPSYNPSNPFQSLVRQPSYSQGFDPPCAEERSQLSTGNELLLQETDCEEDSGTKLPLEAAQPISIPTTPFARRDPDRVPTPLSGRGDRKGHLFPVNDSSPSRLCHFSPSPNAFPSATPPNIFTPTPQRPPAVSALYAGSKFIAAMHGSGSRYTPTSPLSPRLGGGPRPNSPQPVRSRGQNSRPMNIPIPKYHPLHFEPRGDSASTLPSSNIPVIKQPQLMSSSQSSRWMKERQRELIDKAKLSSRIAASPFSRKPDAPRLDPLGDPKGPMTPLALEEGGDYFQVAVSANNSPAISPASRSAEATDDAGDAARMTKASKKDANHR